MLGSGFPVIFAIQPVPKSGRHYKGGAETEHQSLSRAKLSISHYCGQGCVEKCAADGPPCPRSSVRTALTPVPGTRQAGHFSEAPLQFCSAFWLQRSQVSQPVQAATTPGGSIHFHVSMSGSSREVVNSTLYSVHPKSPKFLWTALQSCSLCQLIARSIAHVVLFIRSVLAAIDCLRSSTVRGDGGKARCRD